MDYGIRLFWLNGIPLFEISLCSNFHNFFLKKIIIFCFLRIYTCTNLKISKILKWFVIAINPEFYFLIWPWFLALIGSYSCFHDFFWYKHLHRSPPTFSCTEFNGDHFSEFIRTLLFTPSWWKTTHNFLTFLLYFFFRLTNFSFRGLFYFLSFSFTLNYLEATGRFEEFAYLPALALRDSHYFSLNNI